MPLCHVTTGIFRVPDAPAAAGPSLQIAVTSFLTADIEAEATYVVNRIEADGTKTPIREGTLVVRGPGGSDRAVLKVWEVKGQFVEVNMDLPFAGLKPSVAVVMGFLEDEGEELVLWISPADFADRHRNRPAGAQSSEVT